MNLSRPALALGLALLPLSAAAAEVIRLSDFRPGEIRQARFTLTEALPVDIEAVGGGSGKTRLYAYGWLVNLERHLVVWALPDAPSRQVLDDGHTVVGHARLTLEPGRYALYYFAGHKEAVVKDIYQMGRYEPEPWRISLSAEDDDAFEEAGAAEALEAEIRCAPLGDSQILRQRFHLKARTTAAIFATGELDRGSGQLADRSFLLDLETRRVVWSLTGEATEAGGGSPKNRSVRASIELEAGSYELVALTDASHSYPDWNSQPPYLPDDWGATMTVPADVLDRDTPEERVLVRLAGITDDQSQIATLKVSRGGPMRVYALGEYAQGRFVDHGWIDDSAGTRVWEMTLDNSSHAGGAEKNRMVDMSIELKPGTYTIRYASDDSHSAARWNRDAPPDGRSWGITLSTFDDGVEAELTGLDTLSAEAGRGADRKHRTSTFIFR